MIPQLEVIKLDLQNDMLQVVIGSGGQPGVSDEPGNGDDAI